MYSFYGEIFREFEKNGFKDPLAETLKLVDIVTSGALRKSGSGLIEKSGLTIQEIVRQRMDDRPLEYILGVAPFMGEMFLCAPGALIPREETELLARTCISVIADMQREKDEISVIEIGTGSGNIAVSIALNTDGVMVYASDVSDEAVEVARKNVKKFDVGGRVNLFCGDLFEPLEETGLKGKTDLVVCNPPYIPTPSLQKLAAEIINHEPVVALDAGAYGIDIFRRLINGAVEWLRPGGVLAFEIGAGQDKLITRMFRKHGGYEDIGTCDDGESIRVFTAKKTAAP